MKINRNKFKTNKTNFNFGHFAEKFWTLLIKNVDIFNIKLFIIMISGMLFLRKKSDLSFNYCSQIIIIYIKDLL